jgi:two-component system sensor histidine kinase KdpD
MRQGLCAEGDMKGKQGIAIHAAETLAILILSTLVAFIIQSLNLRVENILIIYILSILVVVMETKSYGWGIISSILCILTFNYFFVEPKYTLVMNDPSYFVSLGIFLVAAFIVNTLTTRLQNQIAISARNEEMTDKLYKMSSGYLNISEHSTIVSYGERSIATLLGKPCSIFYGEEATRKNPEAAWCYSNSLPCGMGENYAESSKQRCIPIANKNHIVGVLRIDCSIADIARDEWLYIDTMLSQFVMAMEREELHQAEDLHRISIEKERLRNNLLRSISHDLRTPLTAIAGGSEFLLERRGNLDEETIRSLLADIHSDAVWLGTMVENLLNMARIQEGKLLIKKQMEVVDDIVGEALSRVAKHRGKHRIANAPSEGILLAPMDGQLIIQVLINFLNNAIEHTKPDCLITVKTRKLRGKVEFSVIDDGGGIDEKMLNHLFESFAMGSTSSTETRKGAGLGLSICKAIVLAHGGTIMGRNNTEGGATFSFSLPTEKEEEIHA